MTPLPRVLAQRRVSEAWIKREPIRVRFKRITSAADGAGGATKTGVSLLPPQTFRVAATARQHDMNATSTAGEIHGADWLLIGRWNADVKKGDTFEHGGRWWRIKFVDQRRVWRTGAGVVEHGPI